MPVHFRIRVTRGADIALGPGKVDLLEAIAKTGSITAAARSLGMSYRRAWLLVDTMNRCFRNPVVEAESGGPSAAAVRGSPRPASRRCARYRRIERAARASAAAAAETRALLKLVRR